MSIRQTELLGNNGPSNFAKAETPLYRPSLGPRSLTITSPTIGWSFSVPVHLVHVFGFPVLSLGSFKRVILPKSLPPCSWSWTSDWTLPLLSSTVFHAHW